MLADFLIVSLSFERFNNGQQFSVVGLIPSFNRNYLFGEKSYRMPSAQIIQSQLTKNSTNSIAKNICFNWDMTLQIKMI